MIPCPPPLPPDQWEAKCPNPDYDPRGYIDWLEKYDPEAHKEWLFFHFQSAAMSSTFIWNSPFAWQPRFEQSIAAMKTKTNEYIYIPTHIKQKFNMDNH